MPKKAAKILIIVIPIILIGLGVFIYFTNFTPKAHASHSAKKFMSYLLANDIKKAESISNIDKPNLNAFFSETSLRSYNLVSTTEKSGKFYFLYDFSDKSSPKKARLAIKGDSIIGVKSGDGLGDIPKNDKNTGNKNNIPEEACLNSDDLAFLDSHAIYAHSFRALTMIFQTNTSLKYAGKENGEKVIEHVAKFYKGTKDKEYTIDIRGYASDDKKEFVEMTNLSQKRANKIRGELIDHGVAENKIQIKKPTVFTSNGPDDARHTYIDIDITNLCR